MSYSMNYKTKDSKKVKKPVDKKKKKITKTGRTYAPSTKAKKLLKQLKK